MADPLKTFFSAPLVARLAADLARADADFPRTAFVADATAGLDELELMERAKHIARAFERHLPPAYPDALAVLLRSLGPEHSGDELLGLGMAPFYYLPHAIFVADRGLEHFALSMAANYELTKRFSAEMSIRPYIARYPEETWELLERWTRDPNPHVRRLVSEGTRLRLPWAPRVAWLDQNPERILALLEPLKDDRSSLVRRSVANNLNDLGKVRPELLIQTSAAWLLGASSERRALIEHALRSAIKRGDPNALHLLGYGQQPAVEVAEVSFDPPQVAIGGRVGIAFALLSRSPEAQDLLIDLAVHFVKANGKSAPKVFKLERVSLPAHGRVALTTRVSLAVHTTRVPRPGTHHVEILVNGQSLPAGSFEVVATSAD